MGIKKTILIVGAVSLAALLSTGCTYNISQYGASVDNVSKIKSINKKINVSDFTSSTPGESSIVCRGAGPVTTPGKIAFEKYIKEAFISELKLAGKYDEKSPITISGHLENIDFNSNIGTADWVMTLKATSSNSKSVTVSSKYEFEGSFVADKACAEVAQAFVPAVQQLINELVSSKQFKTLL